MTNVKSTKRALLSSILALFLCFAMLIGTTYAWFTDSVTSNGNIIQSGTLDVTMEWFDGTKAVPAADSEDWIDASTGPLFKSTLWEPGYVEVRHIKIANEGTLALKYQVSIVANGEVSDLADVIDVYYVDPAVQITDRTQLTADARLGSLTEVLANLPTTASGNLLADENDTITLALKMREEAGNEYQNKSIGADFSVVLVATQYTAESDSFDNQYDKDADLPVVKLGTAIVPEGTTEATPVVAENVTVAIPAGAEAGEYVLETSEINVAENADGTVSASMDINLKKDGEKVADDGTTVYTVSVNIGAGLALTGATHNGEDIENYTYDALTGIITFETASFSPFTFTYDRGAKLEAGENETLADVIADNDIVYLNEDITINETTFIKKDTLINLNGYTVTFTSNRGFRVASEGEAIEVTFVNGTITSAVKAGRCIETRSGNVTLNLANVTLATTGEGANQPLTAGGNGDNIAVNITDSKISAGNLGYAITTFNPVDMAIENSTVEGWCALNIKVADGSMGSAGSNITVKDSVLDGINKAPAAESNSFSTIMIEDSNVTISVTGDSVINTKSLSSNGQVAFGFGNEYITTQITGTNVYVDDSVEVNGIPVGYNTQQTASVGSVVINGVTYARDLADFTAALANGGSITLGSNITINEATSINKDAFINLNGYTVTFTSNRGFRVMSEGEEVDVTFANGTILSDVTAGRCIETRAGNVTLNLENVSIQAIGSGATQPLTIGGSGNNIKVNITDSEVVAGELGYAITTFNPVDMSINNSNIIGWAALNIKAANSSLGSAGSTFTVVDSLLDTVNKADEHETNAFCAIKVEDSNVTIDISGDSTIIAKTTNSNNQYAFGFGDIINQTPVENVNINVANSVVINGSNLVKAGYLTNDIGTVIIKGVEF